MKASDLRNKESISWEDAKAYVKNLYDKIRGGNALEAYEDQLLKSMPAEIIEEVNQEEAPPVDISDEVRIIDDNVTQEYIEQSPELQVLNKYTPEVFALNDFFSPTPLRPDMMHLSGHFIDASLNVFSYLRAFGYMSGMWLLGIEHSFADDEDACRSTHGKVVQICSKLNAAEIDIDGLIQNAIARSHEKGYYPPKPILAMTHPGCNCSVLCWAPQTPDAIPDSAPGIPTFGTVEEKSYYKKQMFPNFQDIYIDRWTALSEGAYSEGLADSGMSMYNIVRGALAEERYKLAATAWEDYIKPVKVKEDFIYQNNLGIVRPIPSSYNGITISRANGQVKVYLGDLGREIIIPAEKIEEISLKPTNFSDIESNMYLKDADTIGIVVKVYSNNRILCYLPEIEDKVFLDGGTVLAID